MGIDPYLLSIVTFLPLATVLPLLLFALLAAALGASGLPAPLWRAAGFASSAVTFLLSLRLFVLFDPTDPGFQLVQHVPNGAQLQQHAESGIGSSAVQGGESRLGKLEQAAHVRPRAPFRGQPVEELQEIAAQGEAFGLDAQPTEHAAQRGAPRCGH